MKTAFVVPASGHRSLDQLGLGVERVVVPVFSVLSQQIIQLIRQKCKGGLREIHMSAPKADIEQDSWFLAVFQRCEVLGIRFFSHHLPAPPSSPPVLSSLPAGTPDKEIVNFAMLRRAKEAGWLRYFEGIRGYKEKQVLLLRFGLAKPFEDFKWHTPAEVADELDLAGPNSVPYLWTEALRFLHGVSFYCDKFCL